MRKIDFHVHAYPNSVAPKAVANLTAAAGVKAFTNGTLEGAKRAMSEWETEKFVLLNIASTPAQEQKCNDFCIESNSQNIYAFGSVHPFSDNWSNELDRIYEAGLKGIKIHNEYQGFAANDVAAYKLYEKAASLGLIMLFHGGYDPAFPKSKNASPKKLAKVADDFKGAKIVIAHLGSALSADETLECLVGKDIYLDTSMAYFMISRKKAQEIINAHGSHKILYGTDCPWGGGNETQQYINSLSLGADALENIFYRNAERLLGEK